MIKKKLFLILLFLFLSFQSSFSQITLTEIMFDPAESEYYYEFIEIYNLSETELVDLSDWSISDGQDFDKIISIDNDIVLAPGQFAIILDPGYFEHDPVYAELIPDDALILTIDGSTFGSSGLSNSTEETISLINSAGTTESSYSYSIDNSPGYSDEKIELTANNNPENWSNSKAFNGTPGGWNSVSRLSMDLSISVNFAPEIPSRDSPITLAAMVNNIGTTTVSEYEIIIFQDENTDSTGSETEKRVQETMIQSIAAGDSIIHSFNLNTLSSGRHHFIVQLGFDQDMNLSNNLVYATIAVKFDPKSLVINEIMFRPNSDEPEWIELYNPTADNINLMEWTITDSKTEPPIVIAEQSITINALDYAIITQDETITQQYPQIDAPVIAVQNWPALNNDFDEIIVRDITATTIDSVAYFGEWSDTKGLSLERIDHNEASDSANWAPCKSDIGATPGAENSVSPLPYDLTVQQIKFSTAVAEAGEDVLITAVIENVGRQTVNGFSAYFYADVNHDSLFTNDELINEAIPYSADIARYELVEVQTNWQNMSSGELSIAVMIQSQQDQNSENDTLVTSYNVSFEKNCLIINEIMYSPLSAESEWIEFYNRSDDKINLKNWSFSDADTAERIMITQNSATIAPNSWLVICKDTLSADVFPNIPGPIVVNSKFPSLNNDEENIWLFDLNGKLIDNVKFEASWGGDYGISLERFNPDIASSDSSNWSSCVAIEGGTPGKQNSIYVKNIPTTTRIKISPNPFSPDQDGFDDVTYINYKLPLKTAAINLKIYDIRGRLVRYLANNKSSAAEGVVIWDGKDDANNDCRMGIYIVYLEAINALQRVIVSEKTTVVLAGRL